jgi:hypothetical protein
MGFTVKKRKKIMNILGTLATHEIIIRAIRALGHAPYTVPADIINGITMIVATHEPIDHRLTVMANQFGFKWELHTFDDNVYGHWVLES